MATILFANNATTTLAGPLTSTATTLNVAAGTGVLFPQPGFGQYFCLTLIDAATGLLNEILHVTAVNGDAFTIVRGQENTAPQSWLAGDLAALLPTAGTMAAFAQSASITSGAFQGTDTGTSPNSAVVTTTTPSLSAPVAGQYFEIIKSAQGNTGPVTLMVGSGGTAASVVYKDGTALGPGEWPGNAAALLYFTGGVYQFVACQGAPAVRVYAGTDTGSADAMVVAPSPPVSALTGNVEVHFVKGTSGNATATPTLAVSGLSAQPVVRRDGSAVAAGDLPASSLLAVKYDTTLNAWRFLGTVASQVAAVPNPNNTQLSTNTNAALSLQQGSQTLTVGQTNTIQWNTNVVPSTVGTYSNGTLTFTRGGWYDVTVNISIFAGSNHVTSSQVTDVMSAQVTAQFNNGSGNPTLQSTVAEFERTFQPTGTTGAGGATIQGVFSTGPILVHVGDQVSLTVLPTNLYGDAVNVGASAVSNMKIQFFNP